MGTALARSVVVIYNNNILYNSSNIHEFKTHGKNNRKLFIYLNEVVGLEISINCFYFAYKYARKALVQTLIRLSCMFI